MAVCCVSVLELRSNSGYFLSLIYMCAEKFKSTDVNYKYFYAPFYSRQLWNFHFLESRTDRIDVGIICSVTLGGVFLQLTQSIEFRSVLSGFSIHAAKQNCGELSQLHVPVSPCWLQSCLCVLSIRPSTSYRLWPVVQGGGSCYHVCLSTETARSSAVIVLLLQLPPRCLVPLVPPVPYFIYYMS